MIPVQWMDGCLATSLANGCHMRSYMMMDLIKSVCCRNLLERGVGVGGRWACEEDGALDLPVEVYSTMLFHENKYHWII